jgi:hypothetical protein
MLVASLNLPRMIYKSTYTVVNIRIRGLIPSDQEQRVLLNNSILLCFVTCFCKRSFHPSCIHSQPLLWEAATARDQRRANSDSRSSLSMAFSNHSSSSSSKLRSHHSQQVMGQALFSRSSLATQAQDNNRPFKRLRSSHSSLAIRLKANCPNSRASNHHNSNLSHPLRFSRHSSRNNSPPLLCALSRPPPRSRSRFRARHPRQLHPSKAINSQGRSQT